MRLGFDRWSSSGGKFTEEKEIESFPQQSEFGGVDPEFSEVETKTLPENTNLYQFINSMQISHSMLDLVS